MFSFDLKEYREQILCMSIEELSKFLEIDKQYILNSEKNTSVLDPYIIDKLCTKLNRSLDEVINYKSRIIIPINPTNNWEPYYNSTLLIEKQINQCINNTNLTNDFINLLTDLKDTINVLVNKPMVAFIGKSDSGKSRLINALLGQIVLPVAWTPTTNMPIYIKHIEDKPNFISDNVCFFANEVNSEKNWNPKKLKNKDYYDKWLLKSGDMNLLHDFVQRQGSGNYKERFGSCVVFLNSSILKVCDLIDLPGFGNNENIKESKSAECGRIIADIIVYLSTANNFLNESDLENLKFVIKKLPTIENKSNTLKPLSNLFILASQAHTVDHGKDETLKTLLDFKSNELYDIVCEDILKKKEYSSNLKYKKEDLRNRFFTYTTDISRLTKEFHKEFTLCIEEFPKSISYTDLMINTLKDNIESLNKLIDTGKVFLKNHELLIDEFKILRTNLLAKEKSINTLRKNMIDEIEQLRAESISQISHEFNVLISNENILKIIEDNKFENNKIDLQVLCSYFSDKIETLLETIIVSKSNSFNLTLNNFINNIDLIFNNLEYDRKFSISYDTERIFAESLINLSSIGAFDFWASQFNTLSTYLLVSKGISLINSLETSNINKNSNILNLNTSVALISIHTLTSTLILSTIITDDTWKTNIANKIVNIYEKENIKSEITSFLNNYWDDTINAFHKAYDKLERNFSNHIYELELRLSKENSAFEKIKINHCNYTIKLLNKIKDDIISELDIISE